MLFCSGQVRIECLLYINGNVRHSNNHGLSGDADRDGAECGGGHDAARRDVPRDVQRDVVQRDADRDVAARDAVPRDVALRDDADRDADQRDDGGRDATFSPAFVFVAERDRCSMLVLEI